MSWRGGALALVLVLADLAASSCIGSRRWMEDEADRIDAIMAGQTPVDAGDAGFLEEAAAEPVAMGTSPPLAPPTSRFNQLKVSTPWSAPPVRVRGSRWSLGRRRKAQAIGRDAVVAERGPTQ